MSQLIITVAAWLIPIGLVGCTSGPQSPRDGPRTFTPESALGHVRTLPTSTTVVIPSGVVQAGHTSVDPMATKTDDKLTTPKPIIDEKAVQQPPPSTGLPTLPDLINMAVERNPRLAQVAWAVETARGRALQAGLYPNPTLSVTGDELGDRTGPGGIWTAPYFQQEIVTGNKLGLSKAAALKEVDQAGLRVVAERYRLFTDVRQNYFEVVTLQQRAERLKQLIGLAEQSVENANKLLAAKEGSRLDVVQLEVELERYRADLDATTRTIPAAFRRLAASVGVDDLPYSRVVGDLDVPLPEYDLDRVRAYVVGIHPDLRAAQIGVERANLALKRAGVEPIPNVTVGTGYVRQNQNRSSDWVIAASVPLPVWNLNQGNILAAKAQVREANFEVGRVQNDLVGRLATVFAGYAAAKERAAKYKSAILPKAEQTYELSLKAYQGGQFEYLRVLQAQRAVAEARLEYLRSLGEAWRSASEIAGLMLEDQWPLIPHFRLQPKE
jgi:outer membrane protein, heavy metal efflux system